VTVPGDVVWVVGLVVRDVDSEDAERGLPPRWTLVGVYPTEAAAATVCTSEEMFVGPLVFGWESEGPRTEWPFAYFPTQIQEA
jgi:hypothetical protein